MRQIVDVREFVVTWMNSGSIADIARALNMKTNTVSARGNYLRKMGVRLPKFHRPLKNNSLLVAQLNALIKKHSKKG